MVYNIAPASGTSSPLSTAFNSYTPYLPHTHQHQSDCYNKIQCCHKLLKVVKNYIIRNVGGYRDGFKHQKVRNKGLLRSCLPTSGKCAMGSMHT